MRFKRVLSFVLTLAFIVIPIVALLYRQSIQDWWVLRSYEPPAEISQLATDTTMTEYGKKVFYVTRPALKQKQEFRGECTSAERTIVLGCYKTGSGIYLYDVSDERLAGVEQVTAAHEMLHAAYDRLGAKERDRIDVLTQDAYSKLTDERIKKNVEAYRERDNTVVPNELHSILGTEVDSLPEELEAHYATYFSDRQKIVAYSKQYEAEFTKREKQVEAYDAQLKLLKAQIDTYNATLDTLEAQITSQKKTMDELAAAGKYTEYNSMVNGYNKLISSFNSTAASLKTKIEQHNQIVAARNLLVVEEQELYEAIDTRVPSAR